MTPLGVIVLIVLVDLLGFSLGALVATLVSAEYPQLIRSLVLLNGMPWGGDPFLKLQFGLWLDLIRRDRAAFGKLVLLSGFSDSFLNAVGEDFIVTQLQTMGALMNWGGVERQTVLLPKADVRRPAAAVRAPSSRRAR